MTVHPSSVLGGDARLQEGDVGPFCVLGIDGPEIPVRVGVGHRIRSHTVIYRATAIGDRFQTGHGVLIRDGCSIGHDVSVGSHTVLEHHVQIGDGVRIHSNCFVPELSVIRPRAWLGPGVVVTNARYPNRPDTKNSLQGVEVDEGATIGAGVVLLPGVRIGRGATVGAGAVVVGDVAPGSTVVGNPGRQL